MGAERKSLLNDWRFYGALGVACSYGYYRVTLDHEPDPRCPWPFVFFHDPTQGIYDWQTWAAVSVAIAYIGGNRI